MRTHLGIREVMRLAPVHPARLAAVLRSCLDVACALHQHLPLHVQHADASAQQALLAQVALPTPKTIRRCLFVSVAAGACIHMFLPLHGPA